MIPGSIVRVYEGKLMPQQNKDWAPWYYAFIFYVKEMVEVGTQEY